jgi:probable addiction module antidote protein
MTKSSIMANKTYAQWRQEKLADPDRAARYLNAAYRTSKEAFQHAVLNVIQAHKVATVAKRVGGRRESFYRSFGPHGNPAFYTFDAVMKLLNIGIEFKATAETTRQRVQKLKGKTDSSSTRRPVVAQTFLVPVFNRPSIFPQALKAAASGGSVWAATGDTNGLIPLSLKQQYSPSVGLSADILNLISATRIYATGQQNTAAVQEFDRIQ